MHMVRSILSLIRLALSELLPSLRERPEAGPEGRAASFEAHARRLTEANLYITAAVVLLLNLLAWPLDLLIFARPSPQWSAIQWWHLAVLLTCLGSVAALRLPGIARRPALVGMAAFGLIMAASGRLMGSVGGLGSPLFYGVYTAPLMTVLLVVRLPLRVAATLLTVGTFLAVFVGVAEPRLALRELGTPLVWLAATSVTVVTVGHVVYLLLRANFHQRQTLDRRARQLHALTADLDRQVERQSEELRRLAENLAAVQEQERRRMAQDLHDGLGQTLAALTLELGLLERRLEPDGAAESCRRAVALSEAVHQGIHEAIQALHPRVLDTRGLTGALQEAARLLSRGGGLRCEVRLNVDETRLSPRQTAALFRIGQELLNNAARHSGARRVVLAFEGEREGDGVTLAVEDDGRGFDPGAAPDGGSGGLGLLGIRARARMLGGQCSIDSAPGRGTRVVVRVPVSAGGQRAEELAR